MIATIEVNGRTVEYEREGSGSPVIFSSPTWWPLDAWRLSGMPELRASHDVIAFNHRGIGNSEATAGEYTIESMAADTLALADALDLAGFHVVGYANGCGVGVAAAQQQPGRVRSLTMAAPSNGLPASAPSPAEAERKAIARAESFDALIRSYPTALSHPSFERNHAEMVRELADAMTRNIGTIDNFLKHAEARRGYALLEMAAGLTTPSLVIAGADDTAVRGTLSQIDAARALADVIPGSKLMIAGNVGHMVFWEAPSLWDEVLAFIETA